MFFKVREMTASKTQDKRVFTPMTQKGFLANFSLPLHPLYRQQQPAAHILTMYSTPNTTMVTISCGKKQNGGVNLVTLIYMQNTVKILNKVILTKMYKALSELCVNSLMVAKTESIRHENTKRKLERMRQSKVIASTLLFRVSHCYT